MNDYTFAWAIIATWYGIVMTVRYIRLVHGVERLRDRLRGEQQ